MTIPAIIGQGGPAKNFESELCQSAAPYRSIVFSGLIKLKLQHRTRI